MTPGYLVLVVPIVWLVAFRLSRGAWRFRSKGGVDALARNVSLITANVAVVALNVALLVVVRIVR